MIQRPINTHNIPNKHALLTLINPSTPNALSPSAFKRRPYFKKLGKKYRSVYGTAVDAYYYGDNISNTNNGGGQVGNNSVDESEEEADHIYDDVGHEGDDNEKIDMASASASASANCLDCLPNYNSNIIEKLQRIEEGYLSNNKHGGVQTIVMRHIFSPLISFFSAILKAIAALFKASTSWPPPPPPIHASPRMAAMLANPLSINKGVLESYGFDSAGCAVLPLSDLSKQTIQSLLGCRINRPVLYRKALTHVSAVPQNKRVEASYERLEYLGDAVLELATRSLVMQHYPGANEGKLNSMVQNLVNGNQTARYANFLCLEKYMALNVYEMRDGRQSLPSSQGDVFEALVGGLYLDMGFPAATDFILRVFNATNVWSSDFGALPLDYKGQLIRVARKATNNSSNSSSNNGNYEKPVVFKTTSRKKMWRDTSVRLKEWVVEAVVDNEVLGRGVSIAKKEAEQLAAKKALGALQSRRMEDGENSKNSESGGDGEEA